MARRWMVRLAACVVAAPLLLAGCSGRQEANDSLPTTKTATTTKALPALGPADFPVPAEARKKTPEGVIAFTKYYVALMNRQAASLDSAPLRDLSVDCLTCTELAKSYDEIREAGHRFRGGTINVSGTGSAVVNGDEGETSFLLQEDPTVIIDASGNIVETRSTMTKQYTGGVRLGWDGNRSTWLVQQLDADPLP